MRAYKENVAGAFQQLEGAFAEATEAGLTEQDQVYNLGKTLLVNAMVLFSPFP